LENRAIAKLPCWSCAAGTGLGNFCRPRTNAWRLTSIADIVSSMSFAQIIFQPALPAWVALLILLSILMFPVALVITGRRMFSRKRHVLERVAYLIVPVAAAIAFNSEYQHLGRGHQFEFSFYDVLMDPIAFAGFVSTAVVITLLLFFWLLKVASKLIAKHRQEPEDASSPSS
jgi:hypothetical protein